MGHKMAFQVCNDQSPRETAADFHPHLRRHKLSFLPFQQRKLSSGCGSRLVKLHYLQSLSHSSADMAPFIDENTSTGPSVSLDSSKIQTSTAKAELFGPETSALLNLHLEDMAFSSQVTEVEKWWSSPRFAGVRRPYTAEQICSARGSLMVPYLSDTLSKKLWSILEERAKVSVTQLVVMGHAGGSALL